MNALSPDQMTPQERIAEVAEILAAGLMRLKERKSSRKSTCCGESSLADPAHPSGHVTELTDEGGTT